MSKLIKFKVDNFQTIAIGFQNFGKLWASTDPIISNGLSRCTGQKQIPFREGKKYQNQDVTRRNVFISKIFSLLGSKEMTTKVDSLKWFGSVHCFNIRGLDPRTEMLESPNYHFCYNTLDSQCLPENHWGCLPKEEEYLPSKKGLACLPPQKDPCLKTFFDIITLGNCVKECFFSTICLMVCGKGKSTGRCKGRGTGRCKGKGKDKKCGGLRKPPTCKPCSPCAPRVADADASGCPPIRQDPCAGPKPPPKPEPCLPKPPTCAPIEPPEPARPPGCCFPRGLPTLPPRKE